MKKFKYTETEINKIMKTLTIIIDTREQATHIKDWFDKAKIPNITQKLDVGDYSCYLPKNEELGIHRDTYFNIAVERKNGCDELAGNLTKDNGTAFTNELIRAEKYDFVLMVEDPMFYENIMNGNMRSNYQPKAFIARLESLTSRYGFEIIPTAAEIMGYRILSRFHYRVRELLKNGTL